MAADAQNSTPETSRLLSCFLNAADDGLVSNAVMLCEMIGDEIQSISLRVAADAMARFHEITVALRPEEG